MSALPLTTPQMRCPTCRQIVAITKSGTVKQHSRMVSTVFSFRERSERCPSSSTKAPSDAHRRFLEAVVDNLADSLRCRRNDEAAALHRLDDARRACVAADEALVEARAALEEVSK